MTIPKKLLVLVDDSERSIQTVNYIRDFMSIDKDTRIVLFHVFSGTIEKYGELENNPACQSAVDRVKKQEATQLKKILARLELAKLILITAGFSEQSIESKFYFSEKGVVQDIIDEAKNGYDAVVLRRRGMGSLKNIMLGSVAVQLLQSLTFIPFIFVGQVPPVKKILLAVDCSPVSMKAVEFVSSLLDGHQHEVCLFHAVPSLGAISFESSKVNKLELQEFKTPADGVDAYKSEVLRFIKVVKNKLVASGFQLQNIYESIITGVHSRSEAIIQEAEGGGYSTIVVGRRSLSKFDAFFMGRVGHEVVHGGKNFTVWVV